PADCVAFYSRNQRLSRRAPEYSETTPTFGCGVFTSCCCTNIGAGRERTSDACDDAREELGRVIQPIHCGFHLLGAKPVESVLRLWSIDLDDQNVALNLSDNAGLVGHLVDSKGWCRSRAYVKATE